MADAAPLLLPRPRRTDFDPRLRATFGEPLVSTGAALAPQGYRITVSSQGAPRIDAADEAGAFYGRTTLEQLRGEDGRVPVGTVEDWPDLATRGVMLDVSRCRVPTLATLLDLVERLASWKVNHLELYMEHTFAYPGHEEVWADAGAFTAEELRDLHAFCAARHVELVPNQNCLGHMERWLVHPRYAPLGIARGVVRGPLGVPFAASTLDPSRPEAAELVSGLLGSLVAALPATAAVHVGLDEPWELADERAGEWGTWLRWLRDLPALEGRRVLVWGDMIARHPPLGDAWPEGVTVCEWGYESNHPFAERTATLASLGIEHWVSPGTSSWMSVVGRCTNAIDNCRAAARAGRESGATGMLVTDWGDWGHLQHLPVSDPALAAAAAMAWCFDTNGDLDSPAVATLLDRHCYGDSAGVTGAAVVAVGDAHTRQPLQLPNISALTLPLYLPQLPFDTTLDPGLVPEAMDEVIAVLDGAADDLSDARPTNHHGRLAASDLRASARLMGLVGLDARMRMQCGGTIESLPAEHRRMMDTRLADHIAEHRVRWLGRSRPEGLDESCAWLEHLRSSHRAGAADPDWAGPFIERVRTAAGPASEKPAGSSAGAT